MSPKSSTTSNPSYATKTRAKSKTTMKKSQTRRKVGNKREKREVKCHKPRCKRGVTVKLHSQFGENSKVKLRQTPKWELAKSSENTPAQVWIPPAYLPAYPPNGPNGPSGRKWPRPGLLRNAGMWREKAQVEGISTAN